MSRRRLSALLAFAPLIVFACTEPRHAKNEAPATGPSGGAGASASVPAVSSTAAPTSAPTSGETTLTPEPGAGVVAMATEPPPRPFSIRSAIVGDDLPAPTKVAQKAAKAKGCGEVHVGGVAIPLMCRGKGSFLQVLGASVPLLDAQTLSTRAGYVGDAEPPTLVDHRLDGTEGPIRDQKEVGACTAFSLASTLDHAFASATGKPGYVSVMHIWSRYANGFKEDAAANNLKKPLTAESLWSYDAAAACQWVAEGDCASYCEVRNATCGKPDEARRAKADGLPHLTLASVTKIVPSTSNFVTVLAKGQDVWFGMSIDAPVFERVSGKNVVVPDFDARDSESGHAMSIVGYRVQANGTYFLLKNSWGKSWGDQGYAWIHESTLTRNIVDAHAYVVDVTPAASSPTTPSTPTTPTTPTIPSSLPTAIPTTLPTATPTTTAKPTATASPTVPSVPTAPPWFPGPSASTPTIPGLGLPTLPFPGLPQPKPKGCAKGQVPDAATGACVAPCADGSAPTSGKCATQSACPKGYVDFFGFCVVAAPTKSGLVPNSGVKYQCAAGGCVYAMPKGVEGCTSPVCTLACPSPRFVIAKGPGGLHCSE
jgi:hypothetical protein